jgi:hypothetical protein
MFLRYMLESDSGEILSKLEANNANYRLRNFFNMLRDGILRKLSVLNQVLLLSLIFNLIGPLTQNSVYVYSVIYLKTYK